MERRTCCPLLRYPVLRVRHVLASDKGGVEKVLRTENAPAVGGSPRNRQGRNGRSRLNRFAENPGMD
jgi:hypothetical protein